MKKTIFLSLLLFSLTFSIFGLYSDEFLIGAYEIGNRFIDFNPEIISGLHDAHYNHVQSVNWTHFYDLDKHISFQELMDQLNKAGIDTNVADKYYPFDPASNNYDLSKNIPGIMFLTSSNYFRFESEYGAANTPVNQNDLNNDIFFYRFDRETGHFDQPEQNESNGHAWVCDAINKSGSWKTISGEMYERWSPGAGSKESRRIVSFCKFAQHWNVSTISQYLANNRLYIRIALKWDEIPGNNDELIQIDFQGITSLGKTLQGLNFQAATPSPYGTTLRLSDWVRGEKLPNSPYRIFSYSISLADLYTPIPGDKAQTLLKEGYRMQYIVPIIKWKQNYPVRIDYIEYEDTIHKIMRENPSILETWLKPRLEEYARYPSNINSYYGMDEACPGNFDSFKRINNYILSSKSPAAYPLTTAVNRWGESKKANGEYFLNIRLFDHCAEPTIHWIDDYPIKNDTNFNDRSNQGFVQKFIDRMLDNYAAAKEYNAPLYVINQSFGQWDAKRSQWIDWIYPTAPTQKCLQLLPLCYGVSGIINYGLHFSGYVTPLTAAGRDADYEALKSANDKILAYGPIIKKASWDRSECIMPSKIYHDSFLTNGNVKQRLADISMTNLDKKKKNSYNGYIQIGYYHSDNEFTYMLVNRRTDLVAQNAKPVKTAVENYDKVYKTYGPQTLRFKILQNAFDKFGSYPALFDPYEKKLYYVKDSKIDIPISAGDGILLQVCGTLPSKITSPINVSKNVVLEGTIDVAEKGSVNIAPDTKTIIGKNAKITINNGGSMTLRGFVLFEEGARIIINDGGVVNLDAKYNYGTNAGIEERGGKLNKSNTH